LRVDFNCFFESGVQREGACAFESQVRRSSDGERGGGGEGEGDRVRGISVSKFVEASAHFKTPQHAATRCNVLYCSGKCLPKFVRASIWGLECGENVLYYTATHCNSVQLSAAYT